MPELIAKVGSSGGYRDGATLHAMTERKILATNAQRHLGKRDPTTNNVERANREGFLPITDPLFDWCELTHEFKFQHHGQGLLTITRLSDDETIPVEEGKPYTGFRGKTEVMQVRDYIRRRRRSHFLTGRPGFHMFGSPAREIWFGGKKDLSEPKVSSGWIQIENKLQIARADNLKWPMGNLDIYHAIGVPVATLTEDQASFIEQAGEIPANGDDERIIVERRTSQVDYKNLPGLDPAIARGMADRQVPVDIRDYYMWDVNEIVSEFGKMNTAISMEKLADEIRLDPVGRGYASMDDDEILASLKTKDRTFKSPVTSGELLAWGAAEGRLARIAKAAATEGATPEAQALQAAAMGAEIMVKRDNTDLDLNKADRVTLLAGLVLGGVLTSDDQAALEALATTTGSRAEELFGEGVELYSGHIQYAKKINAG